MCAVSRWITSVMLLPECQILMHAPKQQRLTLHLRLSLQREATRHARPRTADLCLWVPSLRAPLRECSTP